VKSPETYMSHVKGYSLIILLFGVLVVVLGGCVTPPLDLGEPKQNITEVINETDLTEELLVEDKISDRLKAIIENTKLQKIHLTIQFDPYPSTPEEKAAFEEKYGIKFHGSTGRGEFRVTIPVNRINEIARNPRVKLIRDIPAEEKVKLRIQRGEFYPHEFEDDNPVFIHIAFYSDVSEDEALKILSRYSAERQYGPGWSNEYGISINKGLIMDIANEDAVYFVTATGGPRIAINTT